MIALALALLAAAPQGEGDAGFARTTLRFPRHGTRVAARDLDGDGRQDLLFADPGGFGARRMRADGTYPETHDAFLPHPSPRLAWDLAELGGERRSSIVALVDGKEVRAYSLEDGRFGEGRLLLETSGYLPRVAARLDFVRDVDGDGLADLIVPAGGRFRIHVGREDGSFAAPIEVVYEARIHSSVGDPERLDERFGQSLRIPWFRIEDVDGDGRVDLVSETEEAVHFHVADPELPAEPTWRLDLAALRDELPSRSGVDLGDLLANIPPGVAWRVDDLDGRYPNDLLLQVGSTFRVHRDASLRGPDASPEQVLKLSGRLLHFFVRDVQGDPLPDLQLLRGERVSLGTVLRWLILPGSLDFDLFTYENGFAAGGAEAGFSRRPTRRNRVSIELPRLLSFLERVDELEALIEAQEAIPARRFAADADGIEDDVADCRDGALVVYRGRAPEGGMGEAIGGFDGDLDGLFEDLVLRDLDAQGEGGTKVFDLGEIMEWQFSAGAELRGACAGHEPDERVPLAWWGDELQLFVADLDGDGAPDFVVAGEEDGEAGSVHVVQVLVRRG